MNQKDLKKYDFVYNPGILGSLDVLQIENIYNNHPEYKGISARSLSTGKSQIYYDKTSWLKRIDDIPAHLRGHGLTKTATKIINRNSGGDSLSAAIYYHMADLIALFSLDCLKTSDEWKEKVSGKMWKFQDYYFPHNKKHIREARRFSMSDRMYNGGTFWAVINENGERDEYTSLITCLKRIGEFPIEREF